MSRATNKPASLSDLESLDEGSLESLLGEEDPAAEGEPSASARDLSLFAQIPVELTLEVDSVQIMLGDLLNLQPGEVLPLDRKLGEPLDVKVNGQVLARAEVVVVEGRYGLRLVEIKQKVRLPGSAKES